MEPTDIQIDKLRNKFFEKMEADSDPDRFHPIDIAKIRNSNDWVRRFLRHCDLDETLALQVMWDSCEWRKSFGANDISENNVKLEYLEEGNMFYHNRDLDGRTLLILKSKRHIKGQKNMDDLKRCTVYWFERLERLDKGQPISIFFDMAETGMSNMDMEYTKYLINLFKIYYPDFLNYIFVFEMPWILNAAFKIIKSWLPAKAVQKIKFVTKSNLTEYIAPDQMLSCWGGLDDFDYVFTPEEHFLNLDKQDEYKKKVHFAEGSPMVEIFPSFGGDANPYESTGNLNSSLSIVPNETINFITDGSEVTGIITLTNVGDKIVSYKVKTTSPEKFRVRPSSGTLPLGGSVTINVQLQPGYRLPVLMRDKFLIMHLPVTAAGMTSEEIADMWKQSGAKTVEQHRLKCNLSLEPLGGESTMRNGSAYAAMNSADVADLQVAQLIAKVAQLNENHVKLHRDVKNAKILQWITIVLVLLFGVAVIYLLMNKNLLSPESTQERQNYNDEL